MGRGINETRISVNDDMYKVKMPIGVTFICQILLGLRP
jgi:hypothetical protein